MDDGDTFEVEKVLDKRIVEGKVEYFLKWKNYSSNHNTWEPQENLNCVELVSKFEHGRIKRVLGK